MSEQRSAHSPRVELARALRVAGVVGSLAGVLWFLLAPGGALHGQGSDSSTWFARDAVLGILLGVAGVLTAAFALRAQHRTLRAQHRTLRAAPEQQSWVFVTILAVAAILGAVLAWRIGVFAGDVFAKPPAGMANPSVVFSLRSGVVLLLWPLTSMLVVFFWSMVSHSLTAATIADHDSTPVAAASSPASNG